MLCPKSSEFEYYTPLFDIIAINSIELFGTNSFYTNIMAPIL